MSDLPDTPGMVGISDDIENWNITSDNDTKYATKKRIQAIIDSHPDVSDHLAKYYETDYNMIKMAIGNIPHR